MFYGPILSGAATGASAGSALGPIGAAAGAVVGAGVSAFSQGKMNKKMREWNEKMYARQREDSLSDWAMQNEYNSPQAQMARLKAAGLNPNMVYGQGAVANSSSGPRSSSTGSWSPHTPDYGGIVNAGIYAGLEMEIKKQTLDNLRTQKSVMAADVVKKTTDAGLTGVKTRKGEFDLSLAGDLRTTLVDTAKANLESIGVRNYVALSANEQKVLATSQSISESVQRIMNMRRQNAKTSAEIAQINANIANMRRSGVLQDLDIQQRRLGINPNSNTAIQMVGRLVNSDVLPQIGSKLDRGLKWNKKWVAPFSKEWFNR